MLYLVANFGGEPIYLGARSYARVIQRKQQQINNNFRALDLHALRGDFSYGPRISVVYWFFWGTK